jgi:acyl-CoA synthetase (AMP-forming)/AMP-acid ligase II
MGFFGGNILAWYTGMQGVLSSPERFLAAPWTWFDDCARFGATLTVGPSFAYQVAARTRARRTLPGPLGLRVCITGGEQVIGGHLRACADAFAGDGLSYAAFSAAYGMAEMTLGVTLGGGGAAPRSVWVRSEGLFSGVLEACEPGDPAGRELVSCGTPLTGFEVSHTGSVGELYVSGPSLARGYHGRPDLTAERFTDSGFATRDVGFVDDGELFVVGRLDDRLIVAGRNVDVSDLELEIAAGGAVRKGNCAVVDVRLRDTQRIVLVAELDGSAAPDALLGHVREIAARRHGLRIDQVVALDRGQFPKTPSGKAQRYRCRELALSAMS